ncbi:pentatricopeptide repeat-containing protein At2g20540-like [Arachis stenosperma]|uniref:pentatricopeptide repeat-containing protein At2g20540-like n=1 Tax=Arachis stenosperma TaxID=217475 RepID=UPI0025AB9089|nr:pentatricopeptide repeat-containing protein At2g20540-like [Arachis stenosperma]
MPSDLSFIPASAAAPCVRRRSLLLPPPRRTLPKRLEEVEESVKVLIDAAKTRKVAAEKVLFALSVIEKAKIDPSGFLETLGGNESPERTWMLIFTAEFENLKWSSELVSLERPDSWLHLEWAPPGCHCLSSSELVSLVTVISSSADIACLPHGKEIHGLAWRHGFQSNEKVMRKEARPDLITFVGVLAACSRGLLPNEGQSFYDMMMRDYGINPTVQHYTCMVDLLRHYGKLEDRLIDRIYTL